MYVRGCQGKVMGDMSAPGDVMTTVIDRLAARGVEDEFRADIAFVSCRFALWLG
jgi:hypothetical protein